MRIYQLKLGIALSVLLCLIVLPMRVSDGEGKDLFNLITSELMLFLMCFACWITIIAIEKAKTLDTWTQITLIIVINIIISHFFYFAPTIFFGAPVSIIKNDVLDTGVLRLSARGILVSVVLLPFVYYVAKQKEMQKAKIENERLKRENLQAHFNFLQHKMNPHFMFNSLNVLRSGLHDEWARNYVVQLSHVYRYLLKEMDESGVVPLQKELEFLHAYIHILRERFEDSFLVQLDIDPSDVERYKIITMSLQTLIENAIKHNIVSQQKPLKIQIFRQGEYIVVKNNLQKKTGSSVSSAGIGLKNLNERYKLAGRSGILIEEEKDEFIVKVPVFPVG